MSRRLSLSIAAIAASASCLAGGTPANAVVYAVSGVTSGATYAAGSVPAAGCNGGLVLSVSTTPTVGGQHSETATCSLVIPGFFDPITGVMIFPPMNIPMVSATYAVIDLQPGYIHAPADITVVATSLDGAHVTYTVEASPSYTCNHEGDLFAIGVTHVICTTGVSATGEFNVTVTDPALVTVTVPSKVKASTRNKSGANVSFAVTARDSLDGSLVATCDHLSGSHFKVGTTKVTCSATNSRGLVADKSFNVVVSLHH